MAQRDHRDTGSALYYGILALFWLAVTIYSIYLLVNPTDTPDLLREIWAWMTAHPYLCIGIMAAICATDFVWAWIKANVRTEENLEAIRKQMDSMAKDIAKLKSDLDDLSREMSK